MLFIPQQLVKVEITEDQKIIILTKTKLMFGTLQFFQQYLSLPLVGGNPKNFYYAPQATEVLVQSQNTLQIIYCDWKTQIKLKRVIILNNEPVFSVYYDKNTGWNILGNLLQYEQPKVTYHSFKKSVQKTMATCYIQENKYFLTQNKLYKECIKQDPLEVTWKDMKMVLKNTKAQIRMAGAVSSDKQKDIICINEKYILVIQKFHVLMTIQRDKFLYIENSLFISELDNGRFLNFACLQHRNTNDLGSINKLEEKICAGRIYEGEITCICILGRELKIRRLTLVEDNFKSSKNKNIKHEFSKIIERSNEQSQFMDKVEEKKPKIREVQVEDEQLFENSGQKQNSEVLERSGNYLVRKKQQQLFTINDANKMSSENSRLQNQEFIENQIIANGEKSQNESIKSLNQKIQAYEDYTEKSGGSKSSFKVKRRQTDLGQGSQFEKNKYKKEKKKKSQKSQKNQLLSNERLSDDYAETPAFNENGFGNDGWGDHLDNKWEQNYILEENELDESLIIPQQQSTLNKTYNMDQSEKVMAFKPENTKLTAELANEIERTSYVKLMMEMYRKNVDKFADLLEKFLWEIVEEKNCQTFFAEHIKAFSPQSTQDKIKRLFFPFKKKEDAKSKITSALKEFKIIEVPIEFLNFDPEFIKTMRVISPNIHIQNILEPTPQTVEYILQSYLDMHNSQELSEEVIKIEGEEINLTHPRNILNIILYMNETLDLEIVDVIRVYCEKIVDYDFDIIKKLQEENVFKICKVPEQILQNIVINKFQSQFRDSPKDTKFLWDLVFFFEGPIKQQYEMKVAVIEELNKANIYHDAEPILNIKQPSIDIYLILQEIIQKNNSYNLINLNLANLYRSLFWLQEQEKIIYCTNEYILLVKEYAEKLFSQGYIHHAFIYLQSIYPYVKKSLIAKLLYLYLDGKLMNRLVETNVPHYDNIFPEIFSNPNIKKEQIKQEKLEEPACSNFFTCSWDNFCKIYESYLQTSIELKMFTYLNFQSAYELFLSLEDFKKDQFHRFYNKIKEFLVFEMDEKIMDDESLNPKGTANVMFLSKEEKQMKASFKESSVLRNEEYLFGEGSNDERQNKEAFKSMTLIDRFMKIGKGSRAKSEHKEKNDIFDGYEELKRLNLLVTPQEILEALKQIYEHYSRPSFVRALQIVENMQKVSIYHVDAYKLLIAKNLEYKFQNILSFNIFTTKDPDACFNLIKAKVKSELNTENFWLIWSIINLFFGKGVEVSKLFLKKIIVYYQNDQLSEGVAFLLKEVKDLSSEELNMLRKKALENNLFYTHRQLMNYK